MRLSDHMKIYKIENDIRDKAKECLKQKEFVENLKLMTLNKLSQEERLESYAELQVEEAKLDKIYSELNKLKLDYQNI